MTLATAQFQIQRQFNTSQDKLWNLLTDPEARSKWGGPNDDDVLLMDYHDIQEGGRDQHRCGPKENPAYTVQTDWFRIDGPGFACFTETVDAEGMRIATSLVTYALASKTGGTELLVDVYVSSFVGPEALPDFEAGWTSALARLTKIIESKSQ